MQMIAFRKKKDRLNLAWHWLSYFEIPSLTLIFIITAINLPYKPYWMITGISLVFIWLLRFYARWRYQVIIPAIILLCIFLTVQVDALGNFLNLYKTLHEPIPYDVFAHFTIPMLSAPIIIWAFATWLEKFRYVLPLGMIVIFSVTINFSLSGFYEVIELWDELFFGGKRIWTLHDTSNDLQWGLFGGIVGAALTYLIEHRINSKNSPSPMETDQSDWH